MELDIAGLDTAGRDELLEQWRSLIGRPPPKHISRSLLIQILAFELQTKLYGRFTKRLSLRLTRASRRDVMRPAFKPGIRFVREYRGKSVCHAEISAMRGVLLYHYLDSLPRHVYLDPQTTTRAKKSNAN